MNLTPIRASTCGLSYSGAGRGLLSVSEALPFAARPRVQPGMEGLLQGALQGAVGSAAISRLHAVLRVCCHPERWEEPPGHFAALTTPPLQSSNSRAGVLVPAPLGRHAFSDHAHLLDHAFPSCPIPSMRALSHASVTWRGLQLTRLEDSSSGAGLAASLLH